MLDIFRRPAPKRLAALGTMTLFSDLTRRELRASLDRMQRFNDKLVEDPTVVFDELKRTKER